MEQEVFANEKVRNSVSTDFIPVRIDLSKRDEVPLQFQTLAPPATIILGGDGKAHAMHQGFLDVEQFLELLRRAKEGVGTKGPEPSSRADSSLASIDTLNAVLFDAYLSQARAGDKNGRRFVEEALAKAVEQAHDEEGGVDDRSPANQKKDVQALEAAIVVLCRGYESTGRRDLLEAARKAGLSLVGVLGPDDSDSQKELSPGLRRQQSMGGNGDTVRALAVLYGETGEAVFLSEAIRLASSAWEKAQRLNKNEQKTPNDDAIILVRGFLALYEVTGEREWFERASTLMSRTRAVFLPGWVTPKKEGGSCLSGVRFARVANQLSRYSGDASLRRDARRIVDALGPCRGRRSEALEAEIMQAQTEVSSDPIHITVVGPKGDMTAKELWGVALRFNPPYLRREWWDRREGALPNPAVDYPQLSAPAAFICASKRCSIPLFTERELQARISQEIPPL